MKRYDTYKDSGVQWIGEIPGHWEVARAKNMFTKENRPTRPEDDVITCFRDGQVTLRKNRRTEGFTESFKEIGYQGIRKGDLVIHQMDAFAGSIGVSDSDGKGTPVYHCCTPKGNYNNYYYCYLLREMARRGWIKALYRGIRERSSDFRFETFACQKLPIPQVSEQESIVNYLDNKLSKIDAYVADKEREINALEELKQTEIANIVTKGLNPNAPMRNSRIAWIGEIPEHWAIVRLGNLFTENKTKNTDLEYTRALKFNFGSLVPKGESGDLTELEETYSGYTKIRKNDIAINGLNLNYDFVSQRVAIARENGILTSAYLIISPKEGVNADYFTYLFKGMDAQKLFHGMGTGIRLTLSYAELKKQALVVPPLPEQHAIVAHIEKKLAQIDLMVSSLRQQIERLTELKQRIISDAVTGKTKI